VKDRTVAHAVIDAYSQASIKERSPEMHLFIEMPHDAVDVNVHPTKAEVRFRDQSYIHELVRRTLGDALGRGPAPELQLEAPPGLTPQPSTLPLPHAYTSVFPSRWSTAPTRDSALAPTGDGPFAPTDVSPLAPTSDRDLAPTIRPMMPLGQFRDTFIIAVDEEGIAIIDQHVAHERVLFERITERLMSGRLESQRLLEPMILELPPATRHALTNACRGAGTSRVRDRRVRRRHRARVGVSCAAPARRVSDGTARAGRRPRDNREHGHRRRRDQEDRGDDGVPCGGEGERSPHAGEDGPHPRRAAADVILDDLSARPAGDAAFEPARSRKELSTHIIRRMSRHAYNSRMSMRQAIVVSVFLAASRVLAQQSAPPGLPPLFFREEWKQIERPANARRTSCPREG
jgi:hypothetical protein